MLVSMICRFYAFSYTKRGQDNKIHVEQDLLCTVDGLLSYHAHPWVIRICQQGNFLTVFPMVGLSYASYTVHIYGGTWRTMHCRLA